MPPKRRPAADRLEERIERMDDGCWLFRGPHYSNGYGCFFDGDKNVTAHGFAYRLWVGGPPEGMEIDHTCNVRDCVNPAHMEAVTHAENRRRSAERRTHCVNGHELTPENTRWHGKYRRCATCCRRHARETHHRAKARRAALSPPRQ